MKSPALFLACYALVAIAFQAFGDNGIPLWTNRYQGTANAADYARAIAADREGNIFVTGNSGYDFLTIKYSNVGEPIWTNRYVFAEAHGLVVDGDGNVFVVGIIPYTGGFPDVLTVKYSSTGLALWTNRWNQMANYPDYANAVAVDPAGNIFVAGYSWDGTWNNFSTIAYSSLGEPIWTNQFGTTNNSGATAIGLNREGKVFVTGSSDGDYVTIAYSNTGLPLWTNRYDSTGSDSARAIAVSRHGQIIVTGDSTAMFGGRLFATPSLE